MRMNSHVHNLTRGNHGLTDNSIIRLQAWKHKQARLVAWSVWMVDMLGIDVASNKAVAAKQWARPVHDQAAGSKQFKTFKMSDKIRIYTLLTYYLDYSYCQSPEYCCSWRIIANDTRPDCVFYDMHVSQEQRSPMGEAWAGTSLE